jgi:energy-coupling factor transporter ATP-binding protein EcfA2
MTDKHAPNPRGTLALHASAVAVNGGALLFLGPSGTGKTTMCRLLSGHTQTLAEDTVYLVPSAGGWKVIPGDRVALSKPLAREQATAAEDTPLQAILRLHQAPTPRLEPISILQTCRHLADAFFEVPRQRKLERETKCAAFAYLATIARAVPGYRFHFDLSSQTPKTLNDEIGLW